MTYSIKKIPIAIFLLCCPLTFHGSDLAPLRENFKEQIHQLEEKLNSESEPRKQSIYHFELAKLYYNDQNQEMSFKSFLKAIKTAKTNSRPDVSLTENEHYQKALKIYIDINGHSAQENTKKIVEQYAPILQENPQYYHLGFIVASAYANQGDFLHYFDIFYDSCANFPDHYMAHKSQAVLHIKLFERMRPGEEKEKQRKDILESLTKASETFSGDPSLYKMMVTYSSDRNKSQIVKAILNKIIDENIIIPRVDLEFYIQRALEIDNLQLAQNFLAKAREWYQYSRLINSAQQYVNDKLNQKK